MTRPRDPAPDATPGTAPGAGSTLVVSSDLAALEREFVAAVRAAKGNDPVAPVLVVAGSHLQHVYLRRRLARALRAAANVRFVTLMDLAGELALPAGEELAVTPASAGVEAGAEAGARFVVPRVDVHAIVELS